MMHREFKSQMCIYMYMFFDKMWPFCELISIRQICIRCEHLSWNQVNFVSQWPNGGGVGGVLVSKLLRCSSGT